MSIFREYKDLGYSVFAKVEEYRLDYRIYQINGTTVDGAPLYGCSHEDSIIGVQPDVIGDVKWDGCSNFIFTSENYLHACSRQELVNLGLILAACWDLAAENIQNWDAGLAK